MVFDFLEPVSENVMSFIDLLGEQSLGKKTVFHTKSVFPDLEAINIAIIGVPDNRGLSQDTPADLTSFRKSFYNLFPGNWDCSIADLGNILPGNLQEDTYYVVSEIVSTLIKKNIIPIIIGGSQDLSYAVYRAYDNLDQMVNLVAIDSKFDFGKDETKHTADSYLSKIIVNQPNNLFNFSNIGYQTYYNSQEEIDLIEKLYFEAYRLGEVSSSLSIAEPVFRDADSVTLDMSSVKSTDSGRLQPFIPNGFNGKEICAIARYSGLSDKVSSFGIYNHGDTNIEAVLMAQIIWYFIEGINFRSKESPQTDNKNFIKYIVPIDDFDLIFLKSLKTERWWIEIPNNSNVNNKLKRFTLLPCSHDDYLKACDQEIPERWWKAQKKSIL
ncbi:MAG: formimidoylglutamase [Flavobacteriaceae bacterium]|jgi:hypothetical protein|nr:formimidoylglutamase [Flavobacteriaceae bacterium]